MKTNLIENKLGKGTVGLRVKTRRNSCVGVSKLKKIISEKAGISMVSNVAVQGMKT